MNLTAPGRPGPHPAPVKWIKAADLLTDDAATFGTTVDQRLFAYAQSWLLVHHLMKSPRRLTQFQAYLKAIYPRTTRSPLRGRRAAFRRSRSIGRRAAPQRDPPATRSRALRTRALALCFRESEPTMSTAEPTIGPFLRRSSAMSWEISTISSCGSQELRDRGLIAAEAYETIRAESESRRQAIERARAFRAALSRASGARMSARRGVGLGRAGSGDRSRASRGLGSWVRLQWALDEDRSGHPRGARAAERFPVLELRARADSAAEAAARPQARRAESRAGSSRIRAEPVARPGEDAFESIATLIRFALCTKSSPISARHVDALGLAAFASRRTGELDEAMRALRASRPRAAQESGLVRTGPGKLAPQHGPPAAMTAAGAAAALTDSPESARRAAVSAERFDQPRRGRASPVNS